MRSRASRPSASPRRTPTAPAARCRRRSRPGSPRASLAEAVREAKAYVTAAIAASDQLKIGHGHGPVHHFHDWWGQGKKNAMSITRRNLVGAAALTATRRRAECRARADAALAHGHVVAEAAARSRHVGRARRRAHQGAVGRTAGDHGVGRGRGGAGLRGAGRGRRRRRRDGPHRLVLLAGQGAGGGVLHHRAVRADAERARRLGRCRRRAGAVGRALCAVRGEAVHGAAIPASAWAAGFAARSRAARICAA